MGKTHKWSEYEKDFLRRMYPTTTGIAAAKKLNRSHYSIIHMAARLGLKKSDDIYFLRDREILDLWNTGLHTAREIAELTGLSYDKIKRIFSRRKAKNRTEVVFILSKKLYSEGKPLQEIADYFRRDISGIRRMLITERRNFVRRCTFCGGAYKGRESQMFCSEECCNAYPRSNGRCLICGELFKARLESAKFCSTECEYTHLSLKHVPRDLEIRKMRRAGHSLVTLTKENSLSLSSIYAILAGQSRHILDIEKYRRHGGRRDITAFARTERMLAKKNLERAGVWFWVKNNCLTTSF